MMIHSLLRDWYQRRIIQKSNLRDEDWKFAFAQLPLLNGLTQKEQLHLKELAILLMHYKSFEAAQGLNLTQAMIIHIALQACLPILYLGLDSYNGWVSVIIYPEDFMPQRRFMDEAGVVHEERVDLAGESWQHGPVILGWKDVATAGMIDGHNVVIHEFAHKLDMQNGSANGYPPLHRNMVRDQWVSAFSEAFAHFQHHCHGRHFHEIDCYAATSPAEFFAVFSEVFFERPALIQHHYPMVYQQLSLYYRQDPLRRLA